LAVDSPRSATGPAVQLQSQVQSQVQSQNTWQALFRMSL